MIWTGGEYIMKGKEFVKIKTNLTETINHLFVDENMIWTGGEYIMNIYDNCKDAGFVMVKDKINGLVCAPVAPGDLLSSVLACQDKFLRVYVGERLIHELTIEGPATAVGFYQGAPDPTAPRRPNDSVPMLYGTEQGAVGLVTVGSEAMRRVAGITDRQSRPGVNA